MNDARIRRALERLEHFANEERPVGEALCLTSVDILEVAGAGITWHTPTGTPYSLGAAGPEMATIHDLELTLGEGPCIDAFNTRQPAAEPDLANPSSARWPAFRAEALRTQARAAFGYPLLTGRGCFGALNLYDTRPGDLSTEQHNDALVMADLSLRAVLNELRTLDSDAESPLFTDTVATQAELHQATGMVAVQLSVPMPDALARLRAHAFAEGRSLSAVASDVVERRLRFEP